MSAGTTGVSRGSGGSTPSGHSSERSSRRSKARQRRRGKPSAMPTTERQRGASSPYALSPLHPLVHVRSVSGGLKPASISGNCPYLCEGYACSDSAKRGTPHDVSAGHDPLRGTAKPDTVAPAYASSFVAAEGRCSHGVRRRPGAVNGCCCKRSLAPPGAAQQSLSQGLRRPEADVLRGGWTSLLGQAPRCDSAPWMTLGSRRLPRVCPSLSLVGRSGACYCSSQRSKAGADSP